MNSENEEFKEGDKVVRVDKRWRGRVAEVLYVYPDTKEWIQIRYVDDQSCRTYDAKGEKFVRLSEWIKHKHKPYKPYQTTLDDAIRCVLMAIFEIKGARGKYFFVHFSWIDPRILKKMEEKKLIEKMGRFSFVLKVKGIEKGNCVVSYPYGNYTGAPDLNITIYQVKNEDGIRSFTW